MTAGVYTTTVDILGDLDPEAPPPVDEWGYPVEEEGVILAGVPALLTERRIRVATEEDAQVVTVHYYTGRLPAGTPVTKDHRLRDQDGTLYLIDYVSHPASPALPADVRLDLRRVS